MTMEWCLNCHRDPAPNLRPPNAVFIMGWQPTTNDPTAALELVSTYGIETQHLTDCDVCHR